MFKVGDYIMKSGEGVCRIEEEVQLECARNDNRVYFLLIPLKDKGAKVYVPIEHADAKLRRILTETEVGDLLDDIQHISKVDIQNDKECERVYKEALRSSDPKLLVGIIKTLYDRRNRKAQEGKKNTAVDDRYVKLAEEHLYSEIGFVLHKDNDVIKLQVQGKIDINA